MHIPLLTTASLSLLLAAAAASPLVTSTATPATDETTFDSSIPPKPRMVAGLQGGVAMAGAVAGVAGAGAAGVACCCGKKQKRGKKRYRAGQEDSGEGCGRQRRSKAQDEEGDVERVELEEGRGGAEDGFRHGGERAIDMPETPPPSYARLARAEGDEIELEARPVRKEEVSKGV